MSTLATTEIAANCLNQRLQQEGVVRFEYSSIVLAHSARPTLIESTVYRPLICVVLQGAKEISAGKLKLVCEQGHMILVSHQLPVMSRIIKASNAESYIAAILPLDSEKLLHYYESAGNTTIGHSDAAINCHKVEPAILSAIGRLLALDNEEDIAPVVAPLIEAEIHARLLHSPIGARLVRLMWRDDKSSQIAKAIRLMSDDLTNNLSILELAEAVGMSKSALHVHFKAVTGMSPLAYIKELRLLKAQALVRDSNLSISRIGFDVGYDSPAQFSREYARKFSLSPRQDRQVPR